MSEELQHKHRPNLFKHVVGQPDACRTLQGFLDARKVPHALGFFGPKGTGKTTLARIMRKKMNCHEDDFFEINAAESRGIDTIRDIKLRYNAYPKAGKDGSRIWLFDEAHRFTGDAQDALLKMVEEPPPHAYFFFASTRPEKLIGTLRDRMTKITLKTVSDAELRTLVLSVISKEEIAFVSDDAVISRIVECSDGSPRLALTHLNTLVAGNVKTVPEQLTAIQPEDVEKTAIDICRAVIAGKSWKDMAAILRDCNEDPEAVRRAVLGYARKVLLGSDGKQAARCNAIIGAFMFNYFDSGAAGLAASCFDVLGKV